MDIFLSISIIIIVSAGLGIIATRLHQPLIIAYILGGVITGLWDFSAIKKITTLYNLSHIGITLLLFLAGMQLHPEHFFKQLKKLAPLVCGLCFAHFLIMTGSSLILGYYWLDSILIGIALMFSSTLLFIKTMPKENKTQKKINSFCLAILILEDVIAIIVLMILAILQTSTSEHWWKVTFLPITGIFTILATFYGEKFVIYPIMKSLGKVEEITILTAFAWCLGMALIYNYIGFSYEIGAFIAGISLSRRPISNNIKKELIFIRDFFLILFFFTLGAEIDLLMARKIIFPTLALSLFLFAFRPHVLRFFFKMSGENEQVTTESSVRLGQASEFGLLISFLAFETGIILEPTLQFIQLVVVFTFIFSTIRLFYQYEDNSVRQQS